MHRLQIPILTVLATFALAGCGDKEESNASSSTPIPPDEMPAATGPTFHKDVEPILQQNCQGCHSPGKIAPFSLVSYDEAKAVAGLMALRTGERVMPPWSAVETDECKPRYGWKDDKRLTDAEIATLKAWSDAGAPEGKASDAPPAVDFSKPEELPGAELTLEPLKPFVTSGNSDQFRCFVLDPKLTEDKYLNGSHVVAGNAKVVHHAVVFLDPKGEGPAKADADGGYDCFGGAEVTDASVVSVWTPGAVPNEYPSNIGSLIKAGSKLVMQVHYHPAGTTAAPDTTKFQMRFTSAKPEYAAFVTAFGNAPVTFPDGDGLQVGPNDLNGVAQFLIPAGVKGHTESMKFTVATPPTGTPQFDVRLYSAQTHMHYVGTDMMVKVKHAIPQGGEPADECLIDTPNWNFNWQRSYAYDAPFEALPQVRPGDVFTFRCTYDNSRENPFVKRALMEQMLTDPQDVTLGEESLNEMCIGIFSIVVKNPF